MWFPGRYCTLGILLTILGFVLVMMSWNSGYSLGVGWIFPNQVVLWSSFPLCGIFAGWSVRFSDAGLLLLFVGMLAHWVVIGALVDRALARRAKRPIDSPPN